MKITNITSGRNPRVGAVVKLRDRRARRTEGRFIIDGARELGRAIAAEVPLVEVFVCQTLCTSDECLAIVDLLPGTGARRFDVTADVFEKLSFGDRADGVLGVAESPRRSLADMDLPDCPLVAVLEGVEKPGNVGAVLRTADAAGLSAVIIADGGTDLFNPNTIRASLGTVFSLPVCTATVDQTLSWLRRRQLQIVTACVEGPAVYTDVSFERPTAIVLGGEATGLSPAWTGDDVIGVKLPMLGTADSLNVSATAAVLFYEALRQRDFRRL